MDHQRIEINETVSRHEVGVVWKVITVVVAVLVALAWPLFLVVSYGTSLETRDTAQTLRITQLEKEVESNRIETGRRIDALDRFREFHLRNHAPPVGGWSGGAGAWTPQK